MIQRIRAFLDGDQRQAFYVFAAALIALLVRFGLTSDHAGSAILLGLAGLLALAQVVIQLANVPFTLRSLSAWWASVGRAAIYAAAGVVTVILVTLGILDQAGADAALLIVSDVLNVIGLGLAILFVPASPSYFPKHAIE